MSVQARVEPLTIPTYPVGAPEKNPVFFDKRVYQGSSGKVYPVPFIDKVYDEPVPVDYQSATLENEYVRLVMLPEIGGRIFIGQDKANGDYDFFYRQDVIKPALVGLAGPWISGGVEFNWPQHHRPGTFMPCDVSIEEEADGARTVWLSEHDPIHRLKGMHGIRLRPGSSLVELRARLCNRTPFTQTFLWWANVAAMVHEQYQSFFPPDVNYVADHAVRAMSSFPQANNPYYGVDYAQRPGANDLSWYRNIPVPTSYMVCQTAFDFFGGYDFKAGGGFVHVADRHIAPGKKQWTWGNHPFGYAWDRELTDANGPYIELMAGVYTDNQPDFTYIQPYETKTFSQYWWPIQDLGPVQQANTRAALRLVVGEDRRIEVGICASEPLRGATLLLLHRGKRLIEERISIDPGVSWKREDLRFEGEQASELEAVLMDEQGAVLLEYRPPCEVRERTREVATEPAAPADMTSADELYYTGEHLEQYRHPTRMPELYWHEALRRDPGDYRCNLAVGRRALGRGEFALAETHLRKAIQRITRRHPNPESGEAHYVLGLCLILQDRLEEAYGLLAKAAWDQKWKAAALYQLACLDSRAAAPHKALERLEEAIRLNADHGKAICLRAMIQRRLGFGEPAADLTAWLAIDPLDHWARCELMKLGVLSQQEFLAVCRNDAQTILDLVFDQAEAGFIDEAAALLEAHLAQPLVEAAVPNPLARAVVSRYVLAWLKRDAGLLDAARAQSPDYFFPSRLQEQIVLEWALSQPGADPVAAYGLGNTLYDRKRYEDALAAWQRSIDDGAAFATVHRNLGIGIWNVRRDGEAARACYLKAMDLDPQDPRLLSEYDQLRSKLNDDPIERLDALERKRELVLQRDDCTVAMIDLLNLSRRSADALAILTSRRFHPWEGGEGSVLRQFTRAQIQLGCRALDADDAAAALARFEHAMDTPENLGEAYHLLQAKADVNYWRGMALRALGREDEARAAFQASADEVGDFAEMAVTAHSPLSYYRGLSLRALGREDEARALFESLKAYGQSKLGETARIDYFATSLPNLLVFEEDLQRRKDAEYHKLIALACKGLGDAAGEAAATEAVHEFNRAEAW